MDRVCVVMWYNMCCLFSSQEILNNLQAADSLSSSPTPPPPFPKEKSKKKKKL